MNRYQVTGMARDGLPDKNGTKWTPHIIRAWTEDDAKAKWLRAHPKSPETGLHVTRLPPVEEVQRRMDASAKKGAKK